MLNKRGISPLIATVLIIGFTVALSAIIITWGTGFTKSMQAKTEESAEEKVTMMTGALIDIKNAQYTSTGGIRFLVENEGGVQIEKLMVRLIGSDGGDTVETDEGLNPFDIKTFEISYDIQKTGIVKTIEVIPTSIIHGKPAICLECKDTEEIIPLLVKNGDAETGGLDNWVKVTGVTSDDVHSGGYSFYVEGYPGATTSYETIPIDQSKSYHIEGWFKSYGTGDSKLYFGFVPYDKNLVRIEHKHVDIYLNTETTLYANVNPADTVVKITDGSDWVAYQYGYIAFNIDDSGGYNDLPNRDLSGMGINSIVNKGSYWEVSLGNACGKSYPAGTKIREHKSGGAYMYSAASSKYVPNEWTKYEATVQGEDLYGCSNSKWWRGTKYVQILMLPNYNQGTGYKLKFDDIKLTY